MPHPKRRSRALSFSVVSVGLVIAAFASINVSYRSAAQQTASSSKLSQPALSTGKTARPIVYIASPYSKGDPAINTHFQCRIFDQLMDDGVVWPVAPLWSHFQHTMFPRRYDEWVAYDAAMIPRYDACLRLNSEYPKLKYSETKSSGADNEVAEFQRLGKPVFYSVDDLYKWARSERR